MYINNHSPWIKQLRRQKTLAPLSRDMAVDVVIVGAGIAGISTAYQILKHTGLSVLLIEGDKVAHGATGHNAGQIVSYFERSLWEMAEEYGVAATCGAQRDVDSAWDILEEMAHTVGMEEKFWTFTGYAGCSSLEQVLHYLKSNAVRKEGGLPLEHMMIARESSWLKAIPKEYEGLYEHRPQKEILEHLNTHNPEFQAALSSKKGCTNSALFCEEVLLYLQKNYWDRFQCVEKTLVDVIELQEDMAECHTKTGYVTTSKHIILCTNGFENFRIENRAGAPIDAKFHMEVEGKVGLMAGYVEAEKRPPMAASYFPPESKNPSEDAYFYLTRRPFKNGEEEQTLLCIGGPDHPLDHHTYSRAEAYADNFLESIDTFLEKTYAHSPLKPIEYSFRWHGLMGYTRSRVRLIGPDPCNGILLYNLGCNGVGILPSLFGATKIAGLLAGIKYAPSLFDPFDNTCELLS